MVSQHPLTRLIKQGKAIMQSPAASMPSYIQNDSSPIANMVKVKIELDSDFYCTVSGEDMTPTVTTTTLTITASRPAHSILRSTDCRPH